METWAIDTDSPSILLEQLPLEISLMYFRNISLRNAIIKIHNSLEILELIDLSLSSLYSFVQEIVFYSRTKYFLSMSHWFTKLFQI